MTRDEARKTALATARSGEGAIVSELLRLMMKVDTLEERVKALHEIIEQEGGD